MDKNILIYWSGGKDSAMALYEISTNQRYCGYRTTGLLTTLTEGYDRISGHGVHRSLLECQAACLGLNLYKTYIPKRATMDEYESVIEEALLKNKREGTNVAATGDIFVEKRRMATFKKVGMKGCFPLMLKNTHDHVRRFLDLGFNAYVVCVDSAILDKSFVGRTLDENFLDQLPTGVDPCGENGEFHTFVFDGPVFRERVKCKLGEVVLRESFYFCDLLLDN
ncbi:MAG TPA: ATP-binding protein [Blastocatellia bacterium]|nr:ATP-binding protein [Blastocatellia bacterium]